MKKALSYKIILLFIAFALSLALAFSFYGVNVAKAAEIKESNLDKYFDGAESFALEAVGEEENKEYFLNATVKRGGEHTVFIKNELVIDDLAIKLKVPDNVSSFKIILEYSSYSVLGAYNVDTDEFDTTITNEFEFDNAGSSDGLTTARITTDNNVISVNVNGETETKTDFYYRIKGVDKCSAHITFDFTIDDEAEDDTAVIAFKSINQKASNPTGDYEQTFEFDESDADKKITTFAKPRVSVNNPNIVKENGVFNAIYGQKYTFTFTVYSVFGNVSNVYIDRDSVGDGSIDVDVRSETPKWIICKNADEAKFSLRADDITDIEEYTVKQAISLDDYAENNEAPKYITYLGNEDIYENYNIAVQKAATKDYGEYGVHSIRLGDSYEIPSLQDLVVDDYNVYSNLTYTVYYRTPSNAGGSTSSLKFTVSEAGDYEFYVVFKDKAGKAMEQDDFYTLDDDNQTITEKGEYFNAVFKFTVEDDAPISVDAPASQGGGYVNTRYTASEFTIQSSGNNVKYTLFYNAKSNAAADDAGWVEIPRVSDVSEDYDKNGFTYSDIKEIDYDGEYTFTPVKKGAYKIVCDVVSVNQERSASDSTIIKVSDEPTVVKPDDHWFQKNVWSIVFLSIGTLSLIGIVVLLFIKPKEETEKDETGDALNIDAKK